MGVRAHAHTVPLSLCSQDKERSLADQRRYSLIDPSSAPELLRLQRQLMSTEDALREALDQVQQVEKLVEATRGGVDKAQVSSGWSRCIWPRAPRSGRDGVEALAGRHPHLVGKLGTAAQPLCASCRPWALAARPTASTSRTRPTSRR